ncbi:hypothetical protein AHV57_23800 [Salmonella enterica]|nr:hypothetical protein [Salmonella enterica]
MGFAVSVNSNMKTGNPFRNEGNNVPRGTIRSIVIIIANNDVLDVIHFSQVLTDFFVNVIRSHVEPPRFCLG